MNISVPKANRNIFYAIGTQLILKFGLSPDMLKLDPAPLMGKQDFFEITGWIVYKRRGWGSQFTTKR